LGGGHVLYFGGWLFTISNRALCFERRGNREEEKEKERNREKTGGFGDVIELVPPFFFFVLFVLLFVLFVIFHLLHEVI